MRNQYTIFDLGGGLYDFGAVINEAPTREMQFNSENEAVMYAKNYLTNWGLDTEIKPEITVYKTLINYLNSFRKHIKKIGGYDEDLCTKIGFSWGEIEEDFPQLNTDRFTAYLDNTIVKNGELIYLSDEQQKGSY